MATTNIDRLELLRICEEGKQGLLDMRKRESEEHLKTPIQHRFLFWKWETFPKYGLYSGLYTHFYHSRFKLYGEHHMLSLIEICKLSKEPTIQITENEAILVDCLARKDYDW